MFYTRPKNSHHGSLFNFVNSLLSALSNTAFQKIVWGKCKIYCTCVIGQTFPQSLQQWAVWLRFIMETTAAVLKNQTEHFQLNSLHLTELVTLCKSMKIFLQASSFISLSSFFHLCLTCSIWSFFLWDKAWYIVDTGLPVNSLRWIFKNIVLLVIIV